MIVVARTAADAVRIFDQFTERSQGEPVRVRDMDGQPVDIEQLRRECE